jgi:hypothetical protein
MADEANVSIEYSLSLPKVCPQCHAEYRHIQAPHKPLGVSMMVICDCVPIVTREGNVTTTRLVSPLQLKKEKRVEEARQKMLKAITFMRHAVKDAALKGEVHFGILAVKPDGSGSVVARFEALEFFDDLAALIDAPEQTEEDDLEASALKLADELGLREKP